MNLQDIIAKRKKSRSDWVRIALDYFSPKNKGITQKEYASRIGINYKTLNDAFNRHKPHIINALNKQIAKQGSSSRDATTSHRPKSIADQFLESATTNHRILSSRKSLRWFGDTMRKVTKQRGNTFRSINNMAQGKLYTYAYDPLTKERLPYWDQYPLIIFLNMDYGKTTERIYFRGINLHYLSPDERVKLMYELLSHKATTSNLMKNTRLNVTWEDFKYHPKSGDIIKNYLPTHIRSIIREIHPVDWLNIIKLPYQKFTDTGFDAGEELSF